MNPANDNLATVRALLAAAGIDPPEADLAALAARLPDLQARVAALYEIDSGDDELAIVLRAAEKDGP